MKKQYNLKYMYAEKNRVQTRSFYRRNKLIMQDVGAELWKDLCELELKVKNYDFWTPKTKYIKIKQMIKEYELSQQKIKNVRQEERYKQNTETARWLRKKKEGYYIQQKYAKNERYILDLLYSHLEYMKKIKVNDLK